MLSHLYIPFISNYSKHTQTNVQIYNNKRVFLCLGMIMKPFIVSCLFHLLSTLQACSSSPAQHQTVVSPTKISGSPDYLEQYIGQDVSSIRRELNLRQLGYETLGAPIQTPNQLSYTIVRRIQIPTLCPLCAVTAVSVRFLFPHIQFIL